MGTTGYVKYGQLVTTNKGKTSIENLDIDDMVLSAIGESKTKFYPVIGIQHKEGLFNIVKITTETGKEISVTNDKLIFMSIPNVSCATTHIDPSAHYVYLMYKNGYGYRIGTTKNAKHRLNGERADCMWLIKRCDSVTESLYYENLISSKYGLPTMTFSDHLAKDKRREVYRMTQEWIDRLFRELDTETPTMFMAKETGFIFDNIPHIIQQNDKNASRTSVYLTLFYYSTRRRSINPSHLLRFESGLQKNMDLLNDIKEINVTSYRNGNCFRVRKSSTDIEHIKNLMLNISDITSSYIMVRAKMFSEDIMNNFYSLQPQVNYAGNCLEMFYIPTNNNGIVQMERVVKVEKNIEKCTCVSIEVENTANYEIENTFIFDGFWY